MKRRLAVLCALSLTAVTLITGCGSSAEKGQEGSSSEAGNEAAGVSENGSGNDVGSAELTMFWGSAEAQEYTDYIKEVISEFEAENPDIKINLSLVSDPEGQIKQQIAAGGGPDIINTTSTDTYLFASADYLIPLDDYAKQYNWDERFDQWVKDTLSYDEKWYGLPGQMDAMVVYYNVSMFEENGWEIPTTYDELVSLCEAMTEKGVFPFTYGVSDYKIANQWWISQAFCAGLGQEDMHKLLQGEMDWTSDEVRDTVEKFIHLWQNNYIYKDSAAITLDDARSLFTTGKAAMFMTGSWDVTTLDDSITGFDWNVYQMPSWREGVDSVLPVALGGSCSINTRCENPDAAAKFLDYMYQPEVAARMLEFTTLYPQKNIDISGVDAPEKVKMLQSFIDDTLEIGNIGYCAWTYWPVNTDTYAWNNIESVVMGQTSVDEYLNKLQENFELDMEKGNVLEF